MNGVGPRIGSVPYLNARPLLEGLDFPITELVPSQLFEEFQKGMFDAALLSSIDVLSQADASVVDGVAIGSRGAVYSVILTYTGELTAFTKILLDPASHTSNALLQIILGEFHGMNPKYVRISDSISDIHAKILIGDPAISFRNRTFSPEMKILDLGGEWYRQTGLPFVFALWNLKKEITNKKYLSDRLRQAKIEGLSRRPEIAFRTHDPAFALHYLTESIRYDLGEDEKRGLALFQELLVKYQLIDPSTHRLSFL